jgi:hypothetical protein
MDKMIPAQVDVMAIIADLRAWGWLDYKIEIAAGLGAGYIAQVRAGNIKEPAYGKAARLHNFWVSQGEHLQVRAMFSTA